MSDESTYIVYILVDTQTYLPFYVGVGHPNRWRRHYARSHNPQVRGRVKKLRELGHGAFCRIVHVGSSLREALDVEVEHIKFFGRRNNGTGCLLNLTDGGEGVWGLKIIPWNKGLRGDPRSRGGGKLGVVPWNKGLSGDPRCKRPRGKRGPMKNLTEAGREARRENGRRVGRLNLELGRSKRQQLVKELHNGET